MDRLSAKGIAIKGFTIVELLIVVVVVGILAAIVIVAYNNVTIRAQNTARATEMRAWEKLFESYRAINGRLPALATGTYCLGKGFPVGPNGGGVARCKNWDSNDPVWGVPESTSDTVTAALSTVGRIPDFKKEKASWNVGPYIQYSAGRGLDMIGWFIGSGAADCPAGLTFDYYHADGTNRLSCRIRILES